jgi:hypothetical protein
MEVRQQLQVARDYADAYVKIFEKHTNPHKHAESRHNSKVFMNIDRELLELVKDGIDDIRHKVEMELPSINLLTGGCTCAIFAMLLFTCIKVNRMLNKAGNLAY